MKKINDYRSLLGVDKNANLTTLKNAYRSFMKEFHPDKFLEEAAKLEAEEKSKVYIEAYHFLVSIAPETRESNLQDYLTSTSTTIVDYEWKGAVLKLTFADGSVYEYFEVPRNIYNKFESSDVKGRFARRHIYESYVYRNVIKPSQPVAEASV